MRVKRVECNVHNRYPFEESFVSVVSRNFHNLRGRIHGPDGGFICRCSPLFLSLSFFFRALEALESGGVKRGRMTVNQDTFPSNFFSRG